MELPLSCKKAAQRTFAEVVPVGRPQVISSSFVGLRFSGEARVGFSPIISALAENPAQPKGRPCQSIPQGCALKFFWFSL